MPLRVVVVTLLNAIAFLSRFARVLLVVAVLGILCIATIASVLKPRVMGLDTSSSVIVWVPVAVAMVVCVVGDPRVDGVGSGLFRLVPVRCFLVLAIESNSWGSCQLLTLGMILDNFPIFDN